MRARDSLQRLLIERRRHTEWTDMDPQPSKGHMSTSQNWREIAHYLQVLFEKPPEFVYVEILKVCILKEEIGYIDMITVESCKPGHTVHRTQSTL